MKQPLVSRPAYGEQETTASSGLPEGAPAAKGLSLSDDISGTKTFVKPLDDHGTDDKAEPGSLYRIDGPRDMAKPQDGGDDTIDQSHASPAYMGLGEKDPNDYSKTKYPYRDGKPNVKNAANPDFVAQLHILESKEPFTVTASQRTAFRVFSKYAETASQIMSGLNPAVLERSKSISPVVKRKDLKNLRWIFSVPGSAGNTYAVKVHAIRPKKNVVKLSKMDIEIACSCPAWQWQGPEFHADMEEYQNTNVPQKGTAQTPNVRDPEWQNRVCKHVAAVLNMTRDWNIPVNRVNIQKKNK